MRGVARLAVAGAISAVGGVALIELYAQLANAPYRVHGEVRNVISNVSTYEYILPLAGERSHGCVRIEYPTADTYLKARSTIQACNGKTLQFTAPQSDALGCVQITPSELERACR